MPDDGSSCSQMASCSSDPQVRGASLMHLPDDILLQVFSLLPPDFAIDLLTGCARRQMVLQQVQKGRSHQEKNQPRIMGMEDVTRLLLQKVKANDTSDMREKIVFDASCSDPDITVQVMDTFANSTVCLSSSRIPTFYFRTHVKWFEDHPHHQQLIASRTSSMSVRVDVFVENEDIIGNMVNMERLELQRCRYNNSSVTELLQVQSFASFSKLTHFSCTMWNMNLMNLLTQCSDVKLTSLRLSWRNVEDQIEDPLLPLIDFLRVKGKHLRCFCFKEEEYTDKVIHKAVPFLQSVKGSCPNLKELELILLSAESDYAYKDHKLTLTNHKEDRIEPVIKLFPKTREFWFNEKYAVRSSRQEEMIETWIEEMREFAGKDKKRMIHARIQVQGNHPSPAVCERNLCLVVCSEQQSLIESDDEHEQVTGPDGPDEEFDDSYGSDDESDDE